MTKSTGQTFEEVLTWSVDNQVLVENGSGVTAQMMVQEIEMMKNLVVHSTIYAPKGKVLVYVRRRKNRELLKVIRIPNRKWEKYSRVLESNWFIRTRPTTRPHLQQSVAVHLHVVRLQLVIVLKGETHDNDETCAHDSLVVACDKGVDGSQCDDSCDTICIEAKVTMRAIYIRSKTVH